MKQIVNNYLNEFIAHDTDSSADTKYYGYLAPDGRYLIQRLVSSTGVIRYATGSPAVGGGSTAYAAAWTGRAGLTYGYITSAVN